MHCLCIIQSIISVNFTPLCIFILYLMHKRYFLCKILLKSKSLFWGSGVFWDWVLCARRCIYALLRTSGVATMYPDLSPTPYLYMHTPCIPMHATGHEKNFYACIRYTYATHTCIIVGIPTLSPIPNYSDN